MNRVRQKLLDNGIDEEIMLVDEDVFVESLVGTTMLPGLRAVYSYRKMIEEAMTAYKYDIDEAEDYVSYDIDRWAGYMGDKAPIIIDIFEV